MITQKPHYRRTADGSTFRVNDGLVSASNRIGTSFAKAETAAYQHRHFNSAEIQAAFETSWSVQKSITIPAMDACRKWRIWSGEGSAEVQEAERVSRIRLRQKAQEAFWKSRLWGGAAILIGIGDEPLDRPIDVSSIQQGDLKYLTVLTKNDFAAGDQELDPREERFGRPKWFEITTNNSKVLKVHPSRLVEFRGLPRAQWGASRFSAWAWGESMLGTIYEPCRNLDAAMGNIAELIYDAKSDVVKIPGLSDRISDQAYEDALIRRFGAMRTVASTMAVKILDGEESYESKTYSFAGLDKVADRLMQIVASAADIPMTRFLAQSPGGLNSSGDGDLANYYDRIAAIQTVEMQPAMALLDEVLIRSTLGDRPDDTKFEWAPLMQMNEGQIADIRNKAADTVVKMASSAVFDDDYIAHVGEQMLGATGIAEFEGAAE